MKVDIDSFSKEIREILNEYHEEVNNNIEETVDEVAKEALTVLKENAPINDKLKKTKHYRDSLKIKKGKSTFVSCSRILHSDKQYQLTHLLENGHATVNGGRTRAFPHFKPTQDFIEETLPKKAKEKIGG